MIDGWIVATIVAPVAGIVGFFVVIRGNSFEAHTVPLGAFPGAAAAALLGIDRFVGLLVFSLGAAAGVVQLSRRDDRQVATALTLVMLLGLGALLLSLTRAYSQEVDALLFGEILGVGRAQIAPAACLGALAIGMTAMLFRPLLLDTVSPELGEVRGRSRGRLQMLFLVDVAIAATMALPLVGALLVFSLMVGPASAARAMTDRPGVAMGLSAGLALVVVWGAIALSFLLDWPVGFFVGGLSAVAYAGGRVMRTRRRFRPARLWRRTR